MSDYIEREAALAAQNKSMNLNEMRKRLERLPSADVRPVVHGKWEHSFDEFSEYYKCSNCGKEYFVGPIVALNFCAYCGADMREVLGDE